MASEVNGLGDLETKAAAGTPFSRADAERLLSSPDLISVGVLGESARRAKHGPRVTFGRVCELGATGAWPASCGGAGEVRLTGTPASTGEARQMVRKARALAGTATLTGFSAFDLLELCGGDHMALAELARGLNVDGLDAIAELPLDRLGTTDDAIDVVGALARGGLGVWRATVDRAPAPERLDVIERAAAVQRQTSALRAFAPLPRHDPRETPSTGYDDVRTIAIARVMCPAIPSIQVDWPLYGPKLAQVALIYGADDIDGVAVTADEALGTRRAPVPEIERQIRAASATPVERNGRYEPRA